MLKRIACFSFLSAVLIAPVIADTDVVVDDFESYADDAAFQAAWGPTTGLGTAAALPADVTSGILTTDSVVFPGIAGKAIDHIGASASTPGMVNQWGGIIDQTTNVNPVFTINPSASQNIVLKADIYFANNGNERMTVGLRSITAIADGADADTFPDANTANIFEMGQWNAAPTVPGVPNAPTTVTGFGYRLINFGAVTSPIVVQPNWQFFPLAIELNRATPVDTVTNLADIGAGWHQYIATISPTQITLSLDLFRDGKTNLTRDINGAIEIGVGADGVDSSITYDVLTLPAGFNSLRIGGPSGLASAGIGAAAFDNISLRLVDTVTTIPGDFNGDTLVDGRDFLAWQRGESPDPLSAADLAEWQGAYNGGALSAVSVPEPTSAGLLLLALSSLLMAKRR